MSGETPVGIPFVVAAPSGTGKTTICRAVLECDDQVEFSISHTTRPPRTGERNGIDYHFVTAGEFRRLVEAGAFVEHASYGGQNYGTSYESLRVPTEEHRRDVLLEIEVQGAQQVRESRTDARFIFLLPPSMEVLEQRLRGRGTDSEEAIHRRLGVVDRELAAVHFFDYAVVNDDLRQTVESVLEIIAAERIGSEAALSAVRQHFGRESVVAAWREGGEGAA